MKGLLTKTDRSNESTVSQHSKTGKGNMQLHIRMFLSMAVLFAILFGILSAVGNLMDITSVWFYAIVTLVIMGLEYLIGPVLVGVAMRVKWVSEQQEPELHRMVAELAQAAHIPKPKVGISQISVPNAFAYGRTQKDGRICITQGLRDTLSTDELRAVLGHEMSHLRNRDMVIITILSAVPMILYTVARGMMSSMSTPSDGDSDDKGEGMLVGLLIFLAVFAAYYVTELLVLYGSRIREYYADRGSVRLGSQPHQLASALYKLTTRSEQAQATADTERIESAKAFLFSNTAPYKREIANLMQIDTGVSDVIEASHLSLLRQKQVKLSLREILGEVFATHPNVIKRLKALSEL